MGFFSTSCSARRSEPAATEAAPSTPATEAAPAAAAARPFARRSGHDHDHSQRPEPHALDQPGGSAPSDRAALRSAAHVDRSIRRRCAPRRSSPSGSSCASASRAHRRTAEEVSTHVHGALGRGAPAATTTSFLRARAARQLEPITDTLKRVRREDPGSSTASASAAYGALTQQVRGARRGPGAPAGRDRQPAHARSARRRCAAGGARSSSKRVVELAGMLEHCDFDEQETATERRRHCSAPTSSSSCPAARTSSSTRRCRSRRYLDALEAEDEDTRRSAHARATPGRCATTSTKLGAKAYWQQFEPAPEFVIMFLPAETLLPRRAASPTPALLELGPRVRRDPRLARRR